jgi:hypothetical protein
MQTPALAEDASKKPSLETVMQFISDMLHEHHQFSYSYTSVNPSAMEGEAGTFEQGQANWKIDDITASSTDCSIQYKEQNGEPVRFLLHDIVRVTVDTWAKVHGHFKSEPAIYEVDVQMKGRQDVPQLEFTDQRTAQRVARAINYAATLCKSHVVAMKSDEDDAPY